MFKHSTLLVACVCFCVKVSAYEIGKKAIEITSRPDFSVDELRLFRLEWEKNHERLTAMAIQCLADYNVNTPELSIRPSHCNFHLLDKKPFDIFSIDHKKQSSAISDYLPLIKGVRWPDDPTRQIHESSSTAAKFAVTVKAVCKDRTEKERPEGEGIILAADGILCASHYGSLQFLHAMAPFDQIDYKETRAQIIDWAKFAFDFSKNNINQSEKYCDFWRSDIASTSYPSIIEAMQVNSLENRGWCEDRDVKWLYKLWHVRTWPIWGYMGSWLSDWASPVDRWDAWKVSTLFSFHCDGKVYSSICDIINDKTEINNAALGSIIHMIQDSYSSSHTNRGVNVAKAHIICDSVEGFYSYTNQDSENHNKSDKWPEYSCSNESETLDPITAVAQLLWLHQNNGKADDVAMLMERVLGDSDLKLESRAGETFSLTEHD